MATSVYNPDPKGIAYTVQIDASKRISFGIKDTVIDADSVCSNEKDMKLIEDDQKAQKLLIPLRPAFRNL
ncbi:hypothetical protein Bca4012_009155 [Brassica carinata]|uniref:Uncharacterized protein n=1 Tax=Brassica carinata TaxID=52824 RepID=A0A8X7S2F2_BRACI|nr:hypothetical protein Bca52824_034435 [Brassica carinata]